MCSLRMFIVLEHAYTVTPHKDRYISYLLTDTMV